MFIQGPRVIVRAMTRADLSQMAAWHPFEDPLYLDANWPIRSAEELDRWYAAASRSSDRLLYAVANESGRIIGSITLREMDDRRSARLGITIGADFVNQGYGTEALTLFVDSYFQEMGFQKLVLDVAGSNQRAIRVYRKLGFQVVGEQERPMGRAKKRSFLQNPAFSHLGRFFRRDWLGRWWELCYDMQLTRQDWEQRRRGLNSDVAEILSRRTKGE
jgi:diamine N-acetyltransferase